MTRLRSSLVAFVAGWLLAEGKIRYGWHIFYLTVIGILLLRTQLFHLVLRMSHR